MVLDFLCVDWPVRSHLPTRVIKSVPELRKEEPMGHMFSNCLLPLAKVSSSTKPPRYKRWTKTIHSAHHYPWVNLNNRPCLYSLIKIVNPTPIYTYPQGSMSLGSKYIHSWPFSSFVDSAIINLPTMLRCTCNSKVGTQSSHRQLWTRTEQKKKNVRIRLVSLTKVKHCDVLSPYFRSSKQVFS